MFASASQLPVGGATVQAGSVGVACQTDTVRVSYTTQLNGSGVNEITGVVLGNIDGACYGKWADIALITNIVQPRGSGVTAFNLWGPLDSAPTTAFPTVSGSNHTGGPAPLSSDVVEVHVQIKDAS